MSQEGYTPDQAANDLNNASIDETKKVHRAYNPFASSSFVPQQQNYQNFQQYQQSYQQQPYQNYQPQTNQNYQPRQQYQPRQPRQQYQLQPQQQQGMSLADFQKQKAAALAALNAKPKRTLKLAELSTVKLANAPTPPVVKDDKKAAQDENAKTPSASTESIQTSDLPEKEIKTSDAAKRDADVGVDEGKTTKEDSAKSTQQDSAKSETPSAGDALENQSEAAAGDDAEGLPAPLKSIALDKLKATIEKSTATSSRALTPAPTSDAIVKEQEEEIDQETVNDMFGGKDHVSIIFMGHVDAGKSTMGGNILYLTGLVDKRTVEKYEREAKDAGRQGWYLSWVMDTNKEERNDGKTIEVGKAYFETDTRRYTILDAPGHKMYVSEMIGGASQADVGILVISARKGEYETGFEKGGQTREHALLAKTQGVNKIVVVVNKMDDPTVSWLEDRYKDCTTKLLQFLKGIGYAKEDIVCMPVSGYTGAGLKDRVDPKDCPWYSGPALLEFLDNMETVNRKNSSPFMMPISGKMKDMGTVIEGKIESGHIKKGCSLLMMPNKATVDVVGIYNETEQECDAAYCGEQVRLKIKGVEEEDISQGYVLTSTKAPVKTVTRFEAQVAIVELKSILSSGFSCVMHLHAAIEEVKFVELKHKLERGTNRKLKKPPAFAKKGMKVVAVLEASEAVCAETYKDYPQLGRFTLRDQGTTIAIGKITKLLN